jgi:hypothetical protein
MGELEKIPTLKKPRVGAPAPFSEPVGIFDREAQGRPGQHRANYLGCPHRAGFCPVARRIEHLDSDYKRIVRIGLTVHDAGMRVEIATDGANRNRLIGLPSLLGHDAGTVGTYVDGGCEFEVWVTKVIKIHKHLHRNTSFLPAQGGRLWQRCSFGPGGPALGSLLRCCLEAMVLRDNGLLGWSLRMRRRLKGSEVSLCERRPAVQPASLAAVADFGQHRTRWLAGHGGPELWFSWFTVQLIHDGLWWLN